MRSTALGRQQRSVLKNLPQERRSQNDKYNVNVTTDAEKCQHSVVVSHDIHWWLRGTNFLTTL